MTRIAPRPRELLAVSRVLIAVVAGVIGHAAVVVLYLGLVPCPLDKDSLHNT